MGTTYPTTKIVQMTNSETTTVSEGTQTLKTVTLTHYKISAFKVELPRPGFEPFVEIWFAKGFFDNNVWTEPRFVSGMQVRIEGADWSSFMSGSITSAESFVEVEPILYAWCIANNRTPAGTVQDFNYTG